MTNLRSPCTMDSTTSDVRTDCESRHAALNFELIRRKNNSMGKRVSVKNFDGDLARIPEIRNWVVEQLAKSDVSESQIIDIKVALTEALSNILRHAYENELVKPIGVKVQVDDERIEVTLRDFGKKFDVKEVPNPDLDSASEGGYGIYLMRTLLDGVQYIPMKVGTKTVMWKNRSD